MTSVFLDTSGLIALVNTDDQWHHKAETVWAELTDCVSMSLMKSRQIQDAFTADHHFEQAGFNLLIPTKD